MALYLGAGTSRVLWFLMATIVGTVTALVTLQAYRSYTSKNWPVTTGVVVSFHETPHYHYRVGGQTYVNDRVSWEEFLDRNVTIRNSEKYAVRYSLNTKVTVHYHPRKPEMSVLDTRFDSKILRVIGLVLIMFLICVMGCIFGWRWKVASANPA
jgi:hypothetical protein